MVDSHLANDATAGLETVPVLNGNNMRLRFAANRPRPASGKVLIPNPPVATHKLARTYHYISCVNDFPIHCWGRA